MKIVDLPFGNGAEFRVDESQGVITLELKANILGNPEDIQIPLSLKSVFAVLLAGVSNPIAKLALEILVNLF